MGKRTKQTIISNQHNYPEITKVSRFPSRNKEDKAKPMNFLKKKRKEKHLQITHSIFAFITYFIFKLIKMIKESTPTLVDSCDKEDNMLKLFMVKYHANIRFILLRI